MTAAPTLGSLATEPATARPDLLAATDRCRTVRPALRRTGSRSRRSTRTLADTAAFCAAYDVAPEASANCVVVTGRRGGETRWAAAVVLATTRADVNGVMRRRLDVRKLSFAAMDDAVERDRNGVRRDHADRAAGRLAASGRRPRR